MAGSDEPAVAVDDTDLAGRFIDHDGRKKGAERSDLVWAKFVPAHGVPASSGADAGGALMLSGGRHAETNA